MRHDKLQNQLELLLMLTENRRWTVEQMCDKLHLSRRNLYYYLEFFKGADFQLEKQGPYYSISRQSPFVSKLCDVVKFSEDELVTLKRLLDQSDTKNLQINSLRHKLERFYDFKILENAPLRRHQEKLSRKIYQAIKWKRQLRIIDYSSPHSQSVSTRIVEPFLLMNGSADLRAYELSSGMDKTFKLSRMGDVEVLEDGWTSDRQHVQMYTDYFNFASEKLLHVKLRLDQLSRSVLLEEYPRAEHDVTETPEGWVFETDVCSVIGIGRFVIGLFDHVKILEGAPLLEYIQQKLSQYSELAKPHPDLK